MSLRKSSRLLIGLVGAATAAALVMPGAAFAQAGGGGGGGGGRPGEDPAARFNLSVPAIFVDDDPFGLTCGDATEPTGTPLTGYPIGDGYYFVQGTHTWQAQCLEGQLSATAVAKWGDNLAGDAKLKVGKPIRVEIGLDAGDQSMAGWVVDKLEPDALDRLAAYGIEASQVDGVWASPPTQAFPETRVWTPGARLRVYPAGNPDQAVVDETAGAEINATGRVVYGYNLRVADIGIYTLEYTFPDVEVTGVNHTGEFEFDAVTFESKVTIDILVVPAGGGGGGGGPKGPKVK